MMKRLLSFLCALFVAVPVAAADDVYAEAQSPRGVTQAYILVAPDEPPKAAVILFAGGNGWLKLSDSGAIRKLKNNFLVRSREAFAAHGLLVAVVDTPSDEDKINAIFRMSPDHAQDIGQVVADLKARADVPANLPVWLVGTSMGTFSAAGGGVYLNDQIAGLVLTSSITRARPNWSIVDSYPDGVASMDLARVTKPVLVLSHEDDGCVITPAADAPKLAQAFSAASKVETVIVSGGRTQGDPCEAKGYHGFNGIEDQVVDKIAAFILAN